MCKRELGRDPRREPQKQSRSQVSALPSAILPIITRRRLVRVHEGLPLGQKRKIPAKRCFVVVGRPGFEPGLTDPESVVVRDQAGNDMTTYATTYGWRSTGVRRDLMTSPPKQKPVNGGRRGPTGVYGTADPITTNQKAAGSSPAERAKEIPGFAGEK
jgi:hypothetical protein